MFPIRDHNPSDSTPYVTYALILVNVALLLLTEPWAGNMGELWGQMALYPFAVVNGQGLPGLLTHMFVHAGVLHLGGNMLFLWVFGDNLEDQMGHVPFLVFYLGCGLAAAAGQIAADPFSSVPMVGASGAIAGVMGGYLLMFPRARVDVIAIIIILIKRFTIPAWVVLVLWFVVQAFSSYATFGVESGVAYVAHSAGFLAGIVLTFPLFLRRGGRSFWSQTHGKPSHAETAFTVSRVPQVRR